MQAAWAAGPETQQACHRFKRNTQHNTTHVTPHHHTTHHNSHPHLHALHLGAALVQHAHVGRGIHAAVQVAWRQAVQGGFGMVHGAHRSTRAEALGCCQLAGILTMARVEAACKQPTKAPWKDQ